MTIGRWCVAVFGLGLVIVCGTALAGQPAAGGNKQALGPDHPAVVQAERRAREVREVEDELRARLAETEKMLERLRAEMRAVNGGRPVEGMRETVTAMQQDAARLRVELFGLEARKDVIEKAMAAAKEQAEKRLDQDPVNAQYRELLKLLEASLNQARDGHKAGVAQASDVRQAEVALAEAKVKLLERQQSGGADVSKLSDQVVGLSATLSETRARLQTMDDWLTTYERLQRLMDQEQDVRWQMNKLRGMIEHVERVRLDERLGVTRRGAGE
jgi:predicted  nucleic acid-binding Zn-ribbon protein